MKSLFVAAMVFFPLSIYALTCDQSNPHPSANFCLTQGCEAGDRQCERCCEKNCLTCHVSGDGVENLSDPTQWNPAGAEMEKVYAEQAASTTETLSDVCSDCHLDNPEEDRFEAQHNHPVDILYDVSPMDPDLASAPEGVLLVCDEASTNCMLRCVTCHQLHPGSNEELKETPLLRMLNQGSAICFACHKK